MARLIQPDGHCMFLPIDHGYFQGPTRMLEQPGETIKPLLPYADALFATRGVVRAVVDPAMDQPVILRVSGGTSMVGDDLANEGLTTSMEDAVRLNVSAVGISVFIGTEYEKQSLLNLGKLVDEGEKYCIPVPVVMAGGPQADTEKEVMDFVKDGMDNGAIGINLGRNIWQSDYPVPMIRALRHIVHENGTVTEAQEVYDSAKAENGRVASLPA
jgi:putative autoinducer-2 (AI-2) aldolase